MDTSPAPPVGVQELTMKEPQKNVLTRSWYCIQKQTSCGPRDPPVPGAVLGDGEVGEEDGDGQQASVQVVQQVLDLRKHLLPDLPACSQDQACRSPAEVASNRGAGSRLPLIAKSEGDWQLLYPLLLVG